MGVTACGAWSAVNAADEIQRPVSEDIRPAFPDSVKPSKIRSKLRELLGLDSVPESLSVKREPSETTSDGLSLTRLTYPNMLGETVSAVLLSPKEAKPRSLAGVVCMSGTSGSAQRLIHPEFRRAQPGAGPLLGWSRELARRGVVTLSVTLKGTVARRVSPAFWGKQIRMLAPFGRTLMGVMVDEALRGFRVLQTVDAVDAQRIALTGMSLGGNVTWYAAACEAGVRAAVPVCGGVGSLRRQILEGDTDRHSSYFYIPHLLRYFDHPQIVASCICPRPFMMIAPTRDEDMPRSGVEDLIRVVRPAYLAAGSPDQFRVYQPQSRHEFSKQSFERMVQWLKRFC